jgi:hypothetical protein
MSVVVFVQQCAKVVLCVAIALRRRIVETRQHLLYYTAYNLSQGKLSAACHTTQLLLPLQQTRMCHSRIEAALALERVQSLQACFDSL